MYKTMKKWWKYWGFKFDRMFEAHADPAVQLEQALDDARQQDRRLRDQAANVIAGQKMTEMRLNTKLNELSKLNANARQALVMASDAQQMGDEARATQYKNAAETIATQLIQVEKDVEGLKQMVLDSTNASDQAKAAVAQNGRLLQQKLTQKNRLLSQLDQAKMQEELNTAMGALSETVGHDVPTLHEVQTKIEARYAKAKANSELGTASVHGSLLEIEQATTNMEAQSRLSQLRAELGLDGGAQAVAPAPAAPQLVAAQATAGGTP